MNFLSCSQKFNNRFAGKKNEFAKFVGEYARMGNTRTERSLFFIQEKTHPYKCFLKPLHT